MLESITITNFQGLKKLFFNFDERVTSLTGKSDQGKSSAIRALRWVCLNEAPKNLIRNGAEFVRVKLCIDGHSIVRKKSKNANCYILDGKKLKAIGTDVPEEIRNIINVSDVNFQSQLDPHFWFSKTSGQVSKELNQIVNLGVIDQSLFNVASKRRKTKAKEEVIQDRLKTAKSKVKELDWVDIADQQLREIESVQSAIADKQKMRDGIQSSISEIQNRIEELEWLDTPSYIINGLVVGMKEWLDKQELVDGLQNMLAEYDREKAILELESSIIEIDELLVGMREYLRKNTDYVELEALCSRIASEQELIELEEGKLEQIDKDIKELTKGRCPVCNGKLS